MLPSTTSKNGSFLARTVCASLIAAVMLVSTSSLASADAARRQPSGSSTQMTVSLHITNSCAVAVSPTVENLEAAPSIDVRCASATNPQVESAASSFVNTQGETVAVLVATTNF